MDKNFSNKVGVAVEFITETREHRENSAAASDIVQRGIDSGVQAKAMRNSDTHSGHGILKQTAAHTTDTESNPWACSLPRLFELFTGIERERIETDPEKQSAQTIRHMNVKAAWALRQQGLPVIERPDANKLSQIKAAHHELPVGLDERLARLKADKGQGIVSVVMPSIPEIPANQMPPLLRVLTEAEIVDALNLAMSLIRDYELFRLETDDLLFPDSAIERLNMKLGRSKNPTELRDLKERIALIHSAQTAIQHHGDADAVRQMLRREWAPAKHAITNVLLRAEQLLSRYVSEAREAEAEFFGTYGQPPQATAISERCEDALKSVSELRRGQESSNPLSPDLIPNAKSSAIDRLFGVRLA